MENEKNNRLYIYYLATAILFVLLKFYHSGATTDDLRFIIAPVSIIVGAVTGSPYIYSTSGETGYYFADLNILIDKSCSGFNFGCMCLLVLNFIVFRHVVKTRSRLVAFPLTLFGAYLATILVNSSRIILAITLNRFAERTGISSPGWLHLGEGIFVYLFSLVLIYLFANYLLLKFYKDEKLA